MIYLKEAAQIALGAIRGSPLRSSLTLLGVAIGVAVVIAVATVLQGANSYVQEKLASLGSGVFSIQKASIAGVGDFEKYLEAMRKNPDLSEADYRAVLESASLAERVGAQDSANGQVVFGSQTLDGVSLQGVTPSMQYLSSVEIASGRYVSEFDDDNHRAAVVVGADVANALFGEAIDPVARDMKIDGRPYKVVGVAKPMGSVLGRSQDNFVLLPFRTFQKVYGDNRSITITLKAAGGATPAAVQDQARVALRARHHVGVGAPDDFAILTDEATEGFFGQILSIVSGIAIPITLISLVVGGIVVMNIMLVTVTERTREIGIRKSLGARRRDILAQFLCESTFLSAAGGAAGVLIGYGFTKALALVVPIPVGFPVVWSALALMLSAGVGLFFGTYPANTASRLDPIEALRSE
ncbi:MAG: ABC transporter permease [Blastocatellia bacterium]|nr:ABC transporter permease [Blastocatellia bacterium]